MLPTIAECLEHARQCEWYAARTNDEEDRKFLIRKAKEWTKLAIKKELEIQASARAAALVVRPRAAQLGQPGLQQTKLVVTPFANSGSL